MAPSSITEDYYMILGVEQNAAPQLIISAYRRLALEFHPDRYAKHDATSFSEDTLREAAQIAALQKSKEERNARWRTKKNIFDSSVFELQRSIRRLKQEITNLASISAAEAAEEAQKNSWGAWLSSPFYKKVEDNEEEKERKDRERQERRIEKDIKERSLDSFNADLKKQEDLLYVEQEKIDTANWRDDEKIRVIQANIWLRGERERRERERQRQERAKAERERQERERREKEKQRQERERQERERQESERRERERQERVRTEALWKQHKEQWEKREREAAEAYRKKQEKQRAAEKKRKATTTKSQNRHVHPHLPQASAGHAYTSSCRHDGWWPKVQGYTDCPTCYESWTYLLQCPGCMMKACPRCQAAVRPKFRTHPARVRTPSPEFNAYYDYD